MTERLDLYRCDVCGNLVEVILTGDGELVCCGQPMVLLQPKQNDDNQMNEKHVPVITSTNNDKTEIRVGSTLHPMTEEHRIMFIERISDDKNKISLQYFYPNEEPIMHLDEKLEKLVAREYCNLHGLWEAKND